MQYNQGIPTEVGVYAVRILDPLGSGRLVDKFFIWINNKWGYLSSDQNYRGEVLGWIGPLQRKL